MSSLSLLDIKNLSVTYDTDEGKFKAVDNVSFSIKTGEIMGMVGESGSGKSVTALSIMRLLPPGCIESGTVLFHGENIFDLEPSQYRKIRGKKISMIFQEPTSALSPLHGIGTQLVETIRLHNKINKKEAWNIAEKWLARVGIADASERMYAYPFQISGGMQQRVMIAMALILSPELIIADEPTTALDVTIQAQIFELILKMKTQNTSLLLITHDMGVIWEMCDRMVVMYGGRIVEQGPVKKVFSCPAHPYTKGLLDSMPMLAENMKRLPVIPGQVPSPLNYPTGCCFRDRCSYASLRCAKERPRLLEISCMRKSACFYAKDLLNRK
ncbi:dipeptide ABC transporter ATP binding subunit DppD [Candidatus Magnetomoraceae bacterium gMMP-15]